MKNKEGQIKVNNGKITSPFWLLMVTALSIFIAEALVMLLLSYLPFLPFGIEAVFDAFLLTVIVFPMLYFFLFRPIGLHIRQRRKAELALTKAKVELEEKVEERTSELSLTNKALRQEISQHQEAKGKITKLLAAIENSSNLLFITDIKGRIEYVNPMFCKVTGYSDTEVKGKKPSCLKSGLTSGKEYELLWDTIMSNKTWQGTFKDRKKNGDCYWVKTTITPILSDNGEITNFLAVQEDVSEQLASEEKIKRITSCDELTGLYNRGKFIELMSERIVDAKSQGALLLIDLDQFRVVNDTLGHGTGDEILILAATLLQDEISEVDRAGLRQRGEKSIAAHMASDEFAVYFPQLTGEEALNVADHIRKRVMELRHPMLKSRVTASVGIAFYPGHGYSTSDLLRAADVATYKAKVEGRNRCHLYTVEDRDIEEISMRLEGKERLIKAIEEDRIEPWFQPILGIKENQIHHYEALARMRDENGNIISPVEFIDIAERFGLIGEVDRIITEKAMIQQAKRSRLGNRLTFTLNLSGKDLGDDELLSFISSKMLETGADPACIVFEITETEAVHNMEKALKFMGKLQSMGCHFALDDFGVGFTSFVYLKEMKVDYIKIDGSFIKNLHEDETDQIFVKAITDVARKLGISTIAEFVVAEESLKLLKEYGVDYAQGYLIGKPGPPEGENGVFTMKSGPELLNQAGQVQESKF